MPRDKFARHGNSRNDVSAGAATGNEYAQFRQVSAFRDEVQEHGFGLSCISIE